MTPPKLREHLARLFPGHVVRAIEPLAPDSGATAGATTKAAGYGKPVRITLATPDGGHRDVVWRVASSDEFGHDRPSDRAANQLLAYRDFANVPRSLVPHDVGAIGAGGELISLRDAGELYLITSYAPGQIYAEELRRIARAGDATDADLARVDTLARYLAALHALPLPPDHGSYRRAIRDLIGHGEGIFGMIDGYGAVEGVPPDRLQAIERACVAWRWRLRDKAHRLARTHGDFHPFNLVFDGSELTVLDASRGTCGDPADDVIALAINFLLFAVDTPGAWHGLGRLWHRFWGSYLAARPDRELLEVAPPFLAWRVLVVSNPRFYPSLSADGRETLLGLAECALETHHLELGWADELFQGRAA